MNKRETPDLTASFFSDLKDDNGEDHSSAGLKAADTESGARATRGSTCSAHKCSWLLYMLILIDSLLPLAGLDSRAAAGTPNCETYCSISDCL